MPIKIINLKSDWQEWEKIRAPHSFLQSWEWAEAQATLGHKIFRLAVFNADKTPALAFIYKIAAKRGTFLFCPHGPLLDWDREEDFKELIAYLKQLAEREKCSFIRLSPLAPASEKIKKLFKKYSFREAPIHMMHPELTWQLDIAPSEIELFKNMEKINRYSIKRALKLGVEIKSYSDTKNIGEFYKLYLQTAKRQGFVPFSQDYIAKEFEIFSCQNKILLYFALYRGETVATAIIIFANGSAFYHHGASIRKYSNIPAAELLQWRAIKEARRRNLAIYNFWGIAPETTGNHPWLGLSKFKKGFGGFTEQYLHCQDLIISRKYWFNCLVEKLRKIQRNY